MRVTDKLVENWLIWARNHGEIVAWDSGKYFRRAPKGQSRRWRIRLPFAVTANGDPFRAKESLIDLMGHTPEDVVPPELMLTSREALIFGMGCAVGRTAALIGPEHDWQRERLDESWTPYVREQYAQKREEARQANRADLDREADERRAERERRAAEYRHRRDADSRALEQGERSIEERNG